MGTDRDGDGTARACYNINTGMTTDSRQSLGVERRGRPYDFLGHVDQFAALVSRRSA